MHLQLSLITLVGLAAVAFSSPIAAPQITDMAKREAFKFPDLVPSTTVDLATDSTGPAWTGTPKLMPTTVVKLGTTSGCDVWMSTYTFGTATVETGYAYVTSCSDGATPTS